MEVSEYFDRWSQLHGYDARLNPLVRRWLAAAYVLSRPLAAVHVSPHALTLAGVASAGLAATSAAVGGRWCVAAAGLVVGSGLLDSLDGAVAVLRGRVTPVGVFLDAAADRVGDLLFVVALWLAGASAAVCSGGALLMLCHETVRMRRRVTGRRDVGVVTVSERPTRVILTAMFLLGAGLYPGAAALWATAGAAAWTTIGAVGLGQLLLVVHRRLADAPAVTDER